MDAESGAIIVAENHGGQFGVLMIEEPTEAEHEGAPMQQFFIHAPRLSGLPRLGRELTMQHVKPLNMWQKIFISSVYALRRSCVNMEDV